VHPWFAAAAVSVFARRPVAAVGALTGAMLSTRWSLRRAGLPDRLVPSTVATGLTHTGLGLGRYAVQFAAPALAVAITRAAPGTRRAAVALAVTPAFAAWWPRRAEIGAVRFTFGRLADDLAYGTGVLTGCVRHRTIRPLLPALAHRRR
jgi:hypothetical protein